jgi:hypothetical protein
MPDSKYGSQLHAPENRHENVSSIGYAFGEEKNAKSVKKSLFCDELWRRDIERML